MTETVTITHHLQKPEYRWEISIEDQPVVLLHDEGLVRALAVLGLGAQAGLEEQVQQLADGESRALNAELTPERLKQMRELSVK